MTSTLSTSSSLFAFPSLLRAQFLLRSLNSTWSASDNELNWFYRRTLASDDVDNRPSLWRRGLRMRGVAARWRLPACLPARRWDYFNASRSLINPHSSSCHASCVHFIRRWSADVKLAAFYGATRTCCKARYCRRLPVCPSVPMYACRLRYLESNSNWRRVLASLRPNIGCPSLFERFHAVVDQQRRNTFLELAAVKKLLSSPWLQKYLLWRHSAKWVLIRVKFVYAIFKRFVHVWQTPSWALIDDLTVASCAAFMWNKQKPLQPTLNKIFSDSETELSNTEPWKWQTKSQGWKMQDHVIFKYCTYVSIILYNKKMYPIVFISVKKYAWNQKRRKVV